MGSNVSDRGFMCPVCGFFGLSRPAVNAGGVGCLEPCVCCGFEEGFDNLALVPGWTHESWREKWKSEGMKWWSPSFPPPSNWDPHNQLEYVESGGTDPQLKHEMGFICLVCGFRGLLSGPAVDPNDLRIGVGETCRCCGFQFRYYDRIKGWTYREWRNKWIVDGMQWWSEYWPPPAEWDPTEQLKRMNADA
jgi:hypothetical protein